MHFLARLISSKTHKLAEDRSAMWQERLAPQRTITPIGWAARRKARPPTPHYANARAMHASERVGHALECMFVSQTWSGCWQHSQNACQERAGTLISPTFCSEEPKVAVPCVIKAPSAGTSPDAASAVQHGHPTMPFPSSCNCNSDKKSDPGPAAPSNATEQQG